MKALKILTSSPWLHIEEIETHMIEKQQRRIVVCGRFVPSDVAIKIKKKMNRRVEILEVQELGTETNENEQTGNPTTESGHIPMVVYPGQPPSFQFQPGMPMAYCKRGYSTMGIAQVWGNCEYTTEREDEPPYEERREIEIPSWENYLDQHESDT